VLGRMFPTSLKSHMASHGSILPTPVLTNDGWIKLLSRDTDAV
jgi:hypothetical protein